MLKLGKKIRTLRQQRGWPQSDVAQKLGISVAAFSKIETDVTDISLSRLQQLAEVFGETLVQLILPENELFEEEINALKKAKETIERQQSKIVNLQEYVITLYEELHQVRRQSNAHD